MARSEELPIFRDCYMLLKDIVDLSTRMPRVFRYEIGERMVDKALQIMASIYRANSTYDKLPDILVLEDRFRMLQMLFRVCVDLKVLSPKQYAPYALRLDAIGKQITGWRNFAQNGRSSSRAK